jgi:protein tyrosine phosphatase (PTP) superfamily phosphohydrolase (DUF442 family)
MKIRMKFFLLCVLSCTSVISVWAQQQPVQAVETKEPPKYVEISPRLGAGGQPTDEGFRTLAEKGYQAVINLRTDTEKYDPAAEEKLVSSLGMKYFKIPVSGRSPKEEQALEFLKTMDDLKDQKVFIHCAIGVRAGSFVLIDLVLKEGTDQEKAEEIATRVGLSSEILLQFARQVIEHQRGK